MDNAFIFDMDGTIVDNMAYHLQAWLTFFERRGQRLAPLEFFRRTAGRQARETLREYIGADLGAAEIDLLIAEKEAIYREYCAPRLKSVPGFETLVHAANSRGVALAIGTSATPANIDFILDGLGIRRHFPVVVGARDVRRGKPSPDVFLKAAELCGVPPERCIVFEDAPLGVQAARNAGMRAVVLTTTMQAEAFSSFGNVIATAEDFNRLTVETLLASATPVPMGALPPGMGMQR